MSCVRTASCDPSSMSCMIGASHGVSQRIGSSFAGAGAGGGRSGTSQGRMAASTDCSTGCGTELSSAEIRSSGVFDLAVATTLLYAWAEEAPHSSDLYPLAVGSPDFRQR
jgi:hypothetical protein